jgi:integrase
VKSTQLAYPVANFLLQQGYTPPPPTIFDRFDLVRGQAPAHKQIHHMRDGAVVLYKREHSDVWQIRFKLFDRRWHRYSSKYKELTYAKRVAGEMYDRARFREEVGLPQQVKRFSVAADACLKQLDREIEQGLRPRTNNDYKQVINRYLIPFFGKYNLTSVDGSLVREFEIWRNEKIGRMPRASTLMTHASAYNRVIESAIENGWLSKHQNIPTLSRRGIKTKARPAFTTEEIEHLLTFMPNWIASGGHRATGRQIKLLIRDYVEILLATGMRCGKESLNMLWQHLEWHTVNDVRYLRIWVSGKTGGRWLIAKHRAATAFERLAMRQIAVGMCLDDAIAAKLPLRVFAYEDGTQPYGLEGTFRRLLAAAGLSKDKSSDQQRSMYSLRHTYATTELMNGTEIHTLARQMGTSVGMLEKHYSKLTATMAAEQLA